MNRIEQARRGDHPLLLARMESGFAVLGDTQFLPGYCLLLADPPADHLTDLPMDQRLAFLRDMTLIGEAIMEVLGDGDLRRVNYEILGNTDAYLHAHIFPRYDSEPEEYRGGPAFSYPKDRWSQPEYLYDEASHGDLRRALVAALNRRTPASASPSKDV